MPAAKSHAAWKSGTAPRPAKVVRVCPKLESSACIAPRKRQEGKVYKSTFVSFDLCCFPTHRKERDGWGTQFHPLWVAKVVDD
jgi:hypothetical protein